MNIKVNSITGFEDAFVAMYISKRSWTQELDREIRDVCKDVLDNNGNIKTWTCNSENLVKFNNWLTMLLRMGKKHITVLRYIDISIMTEGLHRAGQDDVDAHARRFDNRIIRSSTRLAEFSDDEMSDYYRGKIITTDKALEILNIDMPNSIEFMGRKYYKSPNGYVKEGFENNKDVKRGLYIHSIKEEEAKAMKMVKVC